MKKCRHAGGARDMTVNGRRLLARTARVTKLQLVSYFRGLGVRRPDTQSLNDKPPAACPAWVPGVRARRSFRGGQGFSSALPLADKMSASLFYPVTGVTSRGWRGAPVQRLDVVTNACVFRELVVLKAVTVGHVGAGLRLPCGACATVRKSSLPPRPHPRRYRRPRASPPTAPGCGSAGKSGC